MGLEDLALFRAIPTATIFYPSDGVSTEKAVELAANTKVPTLSAVYKRQSKWEKDFFFSPPPQARAHESVCLRFVSGFMFHSDKPTREQHHLQLQRGLPRWPGEGQHHHLHS